MASPQAYRLAASHALAASRQALTSSRTELVQPWLELHRQASQLATMNPSNASEGSKSFWAAGKALAERSDTPANKIGTIGPHASPGESTGLGGIRGGHAEPSGPAGLAAASPTPAPFVDLCKPPNLFASPIGSFFLSDNTGRITFDLGNYDRCVNAEYRSTLNLTTQTAYCVLEVQGVTFGACLPVECGSTRAIRNLRNGIWSLWLVETVPTLLVLTQEAEGVVASCVTGPDRGPREGIRRRWAEAALGGLAACIVLAIAGTTLSWSAEARVHAAAGAIRSRMDRLRGALKMLKDDIEEANAGTGTGTGTGVVLSLARASSPSSPDAFEPLGISTPSQARAGVPRHPYGDGSRSGRGRGD